MPIHSVWTTNYEALLEPAFRETGKKVDVKIAPTGIGSYP